jgi:uracil-DNA glycosylase family 4
VPSVFHPEPPVDCALCPRLVRFREVHTAAQPTWFNGAVPSFGNPDEARLLIVGLAPGIQGANKTGRPFTGDYAGDLLYSTLVEFGFARGTYGGHPDDDLELMDTMITNAVRCVPPANKPTSAEINMCRSFLLDRIRSLGKLQAIVALGRVAHDSILTAFKLRKVIHKFVHGARHEVGEGVYLYDSYHCSRYNTNTRVLTTEMFHDVFRTLRADLG